MKNYSVIKQLKEASIDLSEMIKMANKNTNCINLIKKSKEAQAKIQTARNLMLNQYLKNITAKISKYNNQEKLTELLRINKYR